MNVSRQRATASPARTEFTQLDVSTHMATEALQAEIYTFLICSSVSPLNHLGITLRQGLASGPVNLPS